MAGRVVLARRGVIALAVLVALTARGLLLAPACALAFVGGAYRIAEPGSIGVHQSSFSPESNVDGPTAVAAVQALTAQIMTYLVEMDVDPRLLQLSLSVPSHDMRYLTSSEMQDYKVTSDPKANFSDVDASGPKYVPPSRQPGPAAVTVTAPVPADIGARASAFLGDYHDSWSRPNAEALANMESAYGDRVQFYAKAVPKFEVMTEKRKFAERWPVRAYSVRAGSEKVSCTSTCSVDGVVDWFARSMSGD